ncbi:hypothetical protein CQW23_33133 [Capsicum baccatum]|uniref:Protein TAR1 n=1 Tax=Capsicum baccatum TaxID=33114 RepID=A0A2G2V2V7_CAPBA|nr:hypothetical protein CQW23_33133 [Capsicum baccatum]
MVPWCYVATVPWCHGATVRLCHSATVPWCHGAMLAWCLGATAPWCRGALVPRCLGATVLLCHGALVPQCYAATGPRCHGSMMPRCLGTTVPWHHGSALVPWCQDTTMRWFHGATVPWFYGALVSWCRGAIVPRCHRAMVSRAMVQRHLGATVHWCHGARSPWCHGAIVPWCHGALVPWCHGAMVPWCYAALVPRCLGAMVPRRLGAMVAWRHDALVPWCPCALAPRCQAALVLWCLGAMVHGFKASATIICKEHRTGQIGVDEGPMDTASTASDYPDLRSRTTTSHDEAREAWEQGRPFDMPRARNAMGESRIPLVHTSSELVVQRVGSISSSPSTADGLGTGTPLPRPQSQSFSRSYRSILLTSLAYIDPSTRGCSPWRSDAVMSTIGRGRHSVLQIFKGRRERIGHHATCGAIPGTGPYLRLSRFQGGQVVKQKRQLLPRLPPTSPDFLTLPSTATSRLRNFNPITFRSTREMRCLSGFPRLLGSTNPCESVVNMEPFPSSAFKVLI